VAADPLTIDRLRRLFRASLLGRSPLARYRTTVKRREVRRPVQLHRSEQPGADFNFALVFGDIPPERLFAEADAFFAAPAVPGGYAVVVEVEAAPAVDAALQDRGWRLDEEEPALVLTPLPATVPAPPSELVIRRVTDEAGLVDFFGISRAGRRWVPTLAAALDPDVAVLVGYLDGLPVATARVACVTDEQVRVADITGVVTLPPYRRRGYGTAMTWAAVVEAARRACAAAVLNATPLGFPVYVKMGFVPVSTYRTYLPPERPSRGSAA
jgi:GNAT superfamily N-acetyltransferase